MRQPQASSAVVDMLAANAAPTAEPSRMPTVAPAPASAPIRPRRPSGACWTRNTIELVYSPPTESPCTAKQGERDRRQKPDAVIAGQQAHQKGRDRHGGHREGERGAASEAIADMADDRAADRPHQIADREHAERRQQLGDG